MLIIIIFVQITSSVFLTAHYMLKLNPDSLFRTYISFFDTTNIFRVYITP